MHIGQHFRKIYYEHSVASYVGIFSFDQPSLLIRDLKLVENVLVKDSQSFTDRVVMFNEKADPLLSRVVCVMVSDDVKLDHM
jgi:cytochrome P450 family 6